MSTGNSSQQSDQVAQLQSLVSQYEDREQQYQQREQQLQDQLAQANAQIQQDQQTLENVFTYDFHEHLSLLGLGLVLVHIVVLLFDKYLPFSLIQLLIPFLDTYRPFWVGLGIISFCLLLLITFRFYLRQRIGATAFRSIHLFSLVSYLGTTLHGLFAGTDSALPITTFLYAGTLLVVVFLTVYWLIMRTFKKDDEHVTVTQLGMRKVVKSQKR